METNNKNANALKYLLAKVTSNAATLAVKAYALNVLWNKFLVKFIANERISYLESIYVIVLVFFLFKFNILFGEKFCKDFEKSIASKE